ncbi:glycosyltransferase [Escherichia coli]|uniref:glycosyltransferase n=1 Tax=Escherichia coli TaxID=562 RepID=UPI000CFB0075|nr:glycosyltransferase [Escherichia coli]EFA6636082.1 glycosyltransferase [Escherichia coli]EFC9366373.1 glycosyltransferase [Escherichia coli]EFI9107078.1 glycosyltransferase [Escherichia coli]EFJ2730074.1 glycosyltransferase [Escherichia coli]EFO5638797.1 glycosyltransferase [Escherichia coli]
MKGFSVLMSVYKGEKENYLDECFKSLHEQTIKANEIILVIDGPVSKELYQVIDKWEEVLPIIKVKLDKNVGLGQALNIGLKHCNFELVARMDTDDYCVKDRFLLQMKFFEEHNDIMVLGGEIEEYDQSLSIPLGKRTTALSHEEIIEFAKKRSPLNHMTVMYKKSFILSVGGYQHHLYMEDYNLWLRVLASGGCICNLPKVLVHVRAGEEMIKRRKGWIYIKSEIQLARLKSKLNITSFWNNYYTMTLRILARLMPTPLLKFVYSKLRTSKLA